MDYGKTIVNMAVTPSDDQNMRYGYEWGLGDLVTVVINDAEASSVVNEVGIAIGSDGVRIAATLGTPNATDFESRLIQRQLKTETRVSNLERSVTGYGINVPYLPEGGTDGTQPTFSGPAITGSYNRFGNMVHFNIIVDFTNILTFGTGQYYLTLPYPCKDEVKFASGCLHQDSTGYEYQLRAGVLAGESVIKLSTTDRQGNRIYDVPFTYNDPFTLTTADRFHIAGTYEIEG